MRLTRVYMNSEINTEQELVLPEPQSHHLSRVLRVRTGHEIHLFNGKGGYYITEITAVDKQGVSVVPRRFIPDDRESALKIVLAQGISRGKHMDYTIQKAVELGVESIIPLITDHGNIQLSGSRLEHKLDHWMKVVISACEQCGRNIVPDVTTPVAFDDWVGGRAGFVKLFLEPTSPDSLSSITDGPNGIILISGPEGGFSERETGLAIKHGCVPVRLGPRVLRTETAAIAAISACQVLWGDMG